MTLSDSVGSTTNRYSTVTNPQSSVSLLLDMAGNPKQSYGYSAYGQANSTLTQNGSLSASLNPYRFQGKRLDAVFNTYDMGARRYSLTTSRWQQQDMYYDASDDLGLSQGGTIADRYEFGSGNPVNYVEADGHCPVAADKPVCEFKTKWRSATGVVIKNGTKLVFAWAAGTEVKAIKVPPPFISGAAKVRRLKIRGAGATSAVAQVAVDYLNGRHLSTTARIGRATLAASAGVISTDAGIQLGAACVILTGLETGGGSAIPCTTLGGLTAWGVSYVGNAVASRISKLFGWGSM